MVGDLFRMKTKKRAQSLIEYGLIIALIAVVAVAILSKFGKTMDSASTRSNSVVTASAGNAMQDYCNSLPGTAKSECLLNSK